MTIPGDKTKAVFHMYTFLPQVMTVAEIKPKLHRSGMKCFNFAVHNIQPGVVIGEILKGI